MAFRSVLNIYDDFLEEDAIKVALNSPYDDICITFSESGEVSDAAIVTSQAVLRKLKDAIDKYFASST